MNSARLWASMPAWHLQIAPEVHRCQKATIVATPLPLWLLLLLSSRQLQTCAGSIAGVLPLWCSRLTTFVDITFSRWWLAKTKQAERSLLQWGIAQKVQVSTKVINREYGSRRSLFPPSVGCKMLSSNAALVGTGLPDLHFRHYNGLSAKEMQLGHFRATGSPYNSRLTVLDCPEMLWTQPYVMRVTMMALGPHPYVLQSKHDCA